VLAKFSCCFLEAECKTLISGIHELQTVNIRILITVESVGIFGPEIFITEVQETYTSGQSVPAIFNY